MTRSPAARLAGARGEGEAGRRPVRLAAAAEADFQDSLRWTAQHFGSRQGRTCARTLTDALQALTDDPRVIGARARNDIASGLFTLHVARNRRKGRHFILFRIGQKKDREIIDVFRLLHDAMDIARPLPSLSRAIAFGGL
ncbi:MAG: type II toxin-antitoxin system RelE/ParE family toxin [Pseudomonadota bacterium]